MKYEKTKHLDNGQVCLLRNADKEDAAAVIILRKNTSGQTDNMLSYPDEIKYDLEEEAAFLDKIAESSDAAEINAWIDGKLVASAGISPVARKEKCMHRAEFGICVERDYWQLGIGRILTAACIECARMAAYSQIELDVVSTNTRAIALYESFGFEEFGRNPKGFRLRGGEWQELVLMRLDPK